MDKRAATLFAPLGSDKGSRTLDRLHTATDQRRTRYLTHGNERPTEQAPILRRKRTTEKAATSTLEVKPSGKPRKRHRKPQATKPQSAAAWLAEANRNLAAELEVEL